MYALHIAKGLPSCLPSSSLSSSIDANFQTIRAKTGKNEFLFGAVWCFLGILGDKKVQNLNIFLKCGEGERLERWSAACLLACPLGAGGAGCSCYFADVSKNGQNPLLPSLCCFCLWCITLEYGSIWLLKGVFSGFCGADVCLYGLRSLRGLWGFCVREWLGGFGACCVFCLSFCQ